MTAWLRTDEAEEAVRALEDVVGLLRTAVEDLYAWRWVIIGLHVATQGFMVVALRDSAALYPLRDDIAEAWLKACDEGSAPPQEKLDSFPTSSRRSSDRA